MSVENQTQQLRLNVTNIHSFLLSKNKEQQKFRRDKINLQKRKISFEKKQQEEKILESVKTSSIANIAQNVAESPKIGILDKIFNFGGLLLTGILVNAVDKIVEEGKKFYNNNKKLFDTIGNFLSSVKDAVVGLLDSFTGPESEKGAFDHIGKFNADGRLIRFEKEEEKSLLQKIEEAYDSLGTNLNKIEKAVGGKGTIGNFLKDPPPASEKTPPASAKTPPPASEKTPPASATPATTSATGQVSSNTNITPLQQQALGVLAKYESGVHGYEAVNQIGTKGGRGVLGFSGSFTNMKQHGGISLTSLTIGDIKKLQYDDGSMTNQQWISAGKLHAVGRYQFIGNTLPGVAKRAGIPDSAKFDSNVQDLMALQLMKERGISPWVGPSDKATAEERRIVEQARKQPITYNRTTSKTEAKITPVPNNGNQAAAVNTPDPRDRRNRRGRIIALQRVNTLVPYTITVPVSSSSSGSSTPINNPLAWA